jgi:DNA-binding NtrC family response regulator
MQMNWAAECPHPEVGSSGVYQVLLHCGSEPEATGLYEALSEQAAVTSVKSTGEMLALLQHNHYDSVLCVWQLGEESWRDALKAIQQQRPNLPVIIVQRTGGEAEWVEVLEAGACDLLTAPYTPCRIRAVLEHAVGPREFAWKI